MKTKTIQMLIVSVGLIYSMAFAEPDSVIILENDECINPSNWTSLHDHLGAKLGSILYSHPNSTNLTLNIDVHARETFDLLDIFGHDLRSVHLPGAIAIPYTFGGSVSLTVDPDTETIATQCNAIIHLLRNNDQDKDLLLTVAGETEKMLSGDAEKDAVILKPLTQQLYEDIKEQCYVGFYAAIYEKPSVKTYQELRDFLYLQFKSEFLEEDPSLRGDPELEERIQELLNKILGPSSAKENDSQSYTT